MAQATNFALPDVRALPRGLQRYATTGAAPSTVTRDLVTVSNQIPRWGWGAIALVSAWFAYRAWSPERPPKRAAEPLPDPEKLTA